jgi:hypothetical protein
MGSNSLIEERVKWSILKHIASHLVAVRVDLPQAQHLFSAYSDKVAASVFLLGGSKVRVYGVLARRRAESFCIFRLSDPGLAGLQVSILQGELRPDRDQSTGAIPVCQPQSLTRLLQLPSDR